MRAYHPSPAAAPPQRVVVEFRRRGLLEVLVGGAVRLVVEVVAWVYCGWAGLPYPERLKS